jgi:hypothetical protein
MTLLEFDHIDFAEVGSDMDHLFGDIHVAFVVAADFGDDFRAGCIHKFCEMCRGNT